MALPLCTSFTNVRFNIFHSYSFENLSGLLVWAFACAVLSLESSFLSKLP